MNLQDIPRGPSFTPLFMRAILRGEKKEFRWILEPQFPEQVKPWLEEREDGVCVVCDMGYPARSIPVPYQPGILYSLREPLVKTMEPNPVKANPDCPSDAPDRVAMPQYEADGTTLIGPWEWERDRLPAIAMPKMAVRAFAIFSVRVERLHDMDADDARAEGITTWINEREGWSGREMELAYDEGCDDAIMSAFETMWNESNPYYPWGCNPWVCVYEFTC